MSTGTGCDESDLAHVLYLPGGECVLVRPAGPQDAGSLQAYIRGLSPASRHSRFLGSLNELSPAELYRMTRTDHRSEGTLIANEAMRALARKAGLGLSAPIADARLVRITKDLFPAQTSHADIVLPGNERAAQSWSMAV